MKTSLARIEAQNAFCPKCSNKIKRALQKIKDISNVCAYSSDSLITFNFIRANELSVALNTLAELEYPPKGDKIERGNYVHQLCACIKNRHNGSTIDKNLLGYDHQKRKLNDALKKAS
ncbi:hypothetical protein [Flagellimonas lutaonensis]|uniref:HMA domain-containing protein n=1 Tax=Flagellimonas lutaonensis TaxID=516051 RepID=A0A0D5YXC5_9FLAO|nr:hypothetical protein [Allomuricauda lutaonensis]AKA36508.1 hypothetical protein VC82_2964 [Allomuricauda lutaonensis]